MADVFVNKVTESALTTIDLEEYLPQQEGVTFDLQPFLFMGLILKEKDFREALKTHDWSVYAGKHVAITCTADAIIPMWAYMLVGSYLQPVSADIFYGTAQEMRDAALLARISGLDAASFADKRVVVKGCGEMPIAPSAYLEITKKLRPFAKSIMYGEPCSTVPIYKRKADAQST